MRMVRAKAWDSQAYLKGMGRSLAPPPGVLMMPPNQQEMFRLGPAPLKMRIRIKEEGVVTSKAH